MIFTTSFRLFVSWTFKNIARNFLIFPPILVENAPAPKEAQQVKQTFSPSTIKGFLVKILYLTLKDHTNNTLPINKD